MTEKPTYEELALRVRELERAESEHKRAEAEFRSTRDRFKSLLDNIPGVTYRSRLDKGYTKAYLSDNFRQLSGYPANDFINDSRRAFESLIHPDDIEIVHKNIEKAVEENRSFDIEYRILRKDGLLAWVNDRGSFISGKYGEAGFIDGILFDITERKESEDSYSIVLSNAQIGMFRTDVETGLVLEANDAVARFVGFRDREEMLATQFSIADRYVNPADREKMTSLLKAHGEITDFEAPFLRNDGKTVFQRFSARLVPEKGWVEGVSVDVTKERRAEQIARTLFRISSAVNTSRDLNELYGSIHHILGEIIDLTNFYIALYDRPERKITFPYFKDMYDSDYAYSQSFSETGSLTGEVILSKKPLFLKEAFLKKRAAENRVLGTTPKVWIGVPLIADDKVIGVMATQSYDDPDHFDQIDLEVLTSVSDQIALAIERKRSEEALRESEVRARGQRSAIAGLALDEEVLEGELSNAFGRITKTLALTMNIARAGIWTLSDDRSELICQSLFEAVPGRHSSGMSLKTESFPRYFDALLSESRIFAHDARNDPRTRELSEQYLVPLGIASMLNAGIKVEGRLAGVVCLEHIGEPRRWHFDEEAFASTAAAMVAQVMANARRRHAEAEHEKLQAQLHQAQKMESVGTLAGGIAHNFNNILMGIQGRASLMMMDKAPYSPDHEHLKSITEYVKNAVWLTNELLGFARGGKYEVRPTDLNELIKNENRMFSQTKKEIRVQEEYENGLWPVEVDQGQIRQALLNLYVNAWQAMPVGGDLYVRTENVVIGEGYLKPFEIVPGRYVKISVTDTGTGMDDSIRERIFDPFFSTKDAGQGSGLGLASVYGIIKNHGGFINVYSEKGEGTTFSIYLPACDKEAEEQGPMPDREFIHYGRGTILLVDDEDMILEVGRMMLERLGYRVLVAGSGPEALGVYGELKEEIDLVILDMIMPGMGGGEVYDRLKTMDSGVQVLLSSGYSINGQAKEILDRGCGGFIQKPFAMEELSRRVYSLLKSPSFREV